MIENMCGEYITSESNLPVGDKTEVQLQVTDKETKEIFITRGRVSKDPDELDRPESLTVMRGPHENIEEQWYIEILETDPEDNEIDMEVLQEVMTDRKNDSNVINTRSEEAKTMLEYLARTGEYGSVSEAGRSIMLEALTKSYPELVSAYVDLKVAADREGLLTEFRDQQ